MALKKAGGLKFCKYVQIIKAIYSALAAALAGTASSVFFGNKIDWMFGNTPP